MWRSLFFTLLCLNGVAHGQALSTNPQEHDHATTRERTTGQPLSPEQKEVWAGERDYFQYLYDRNRKGFLSLWDDRFLGWPDYSDHPLGKREIGTSSAEEFRATPPPARLTPQPEAIGVFGEVAVTHYFWPETDQSSPVQYRVTHTWQKGAQGWHIIGGMDCAVPRSDPSLHTSESNPTQAEEKNAVEATVRGYEQAIQDFDFPKADLLLAPGAKWIEGSLPENAAYDGTGFFAEAKAARVRLTNQPHDFETRIQGDVAWVTLLVDVTTAADNEIARVLLARTEARETGVASNSHQRQWRATYVESEVLVKTAGGWRIALAHTSRLPGKPN